MIVDIQEKQRGKDLWQIEKFKDSSLCHFNLVVLLLNIHIHTFEYIKFRTTMEKLIWESIV